MSKPIKLSADMQAAYDALKQGRLIRYHGGHWAHDGAELNRNSPWGPVPHPSYGVQTLRALVARGLAQFTEQASKTVTMPRFGKEPTTHTRIWDTVCEVIPSTVI